MIKSGLHFIQYSSYKHYSTPIRGESYVCSILNIGLEIGPRCYSCHRMRQDGLRECFAPMSEGGSDG